LRRTICMVLVLATACSTALAEDASRSWKELHESGYTVQYRDDMEELARQIMPEILKRFNGTGKSQAQYDLEKLAQHKDEACQLIAEQLGMAKPSKTIIDTFDQFHDLCMSVQSIGKCRWFRLWDANDLRALLQTGYSDPWLTYIPETDSFFFGGQATEHKKMPEIRVVPMVIEPNGQTKALDQAVRQLDFCQDIREGNKAGMVCHESAEMAMIYDLEIQGAFRRCFTDGSAEYIAAKCLEEVLGKDAATEHLRAQDTAKYKDLKDKVDLLNWRAIDFDKDMGKMEQELLLAHYAYATQEICGLVKRHGPETIPAIFKEISKGAVIHSIGKVRDEHTILDAIKKVTGEDFKARLRSYGSKSPDPLKGIVLSAVKLGVRERDDENRWRPAEETTTIPILTDKKHQLEVTFWFAVMEAPVTLKCECLTKRKPSGRTETETETFPCKERYSWGRFTFEFRPDYMPGDATLKLYVNGKVCKELPFKLVAPTEQPPASGEN